MATNDLFQYESNDMDVALTLLGLKREQGNDNPYDVDQQNYRNAVYSENAEENELDKFQGISQGKTDLELAAQSELKSTTGKRKYAMLDQDRTNQDSISSEIAQELEVNDKLLVSKLRAEGKFVEARKLAHTIAVRKYRQKNKAILAENQKEYYQENKANIANYQKDYRQNNKAKIAEKQKEYQQNNKAKIAEHQKQYYQKNIAKLAEKHKEYQQNNKAKIAEKRNEYKQSNKAKIDKKRKEYEQNNKAKMAVKRKEYYQNKKARISEHEK
jgi:hypothetical protein